MKRLKNLWSILVYGVKLKLINLPMLSINLAILAYTIVDVCLHPESLFGGGSVLVIAFLLFTLLWQVISTCYDLHQYLSVPEIWISSPDEKSEYILDDVVKEDGGYMVPDDVPDSIKVIYDPSVNEILASEQPIGLRPCSSHGKEVWRYISLNKGVLLLFLKAKWDKLRSGEFYNEAKLCQASEINAGPDGKLCVQICKGSYYNSFLTNDIYGLVVRHDDGAMAPPLNISNYGIQPFDKSVFSNHIGVSTIVISSDNKILLQRHNNKTAVSADKFAGSGSGSVDFEDWNSSDTDLRQILVRAAHRELSEEAGFKNLLETVKVETSIVGMYRNLERGGKPDYCLVTRIEADFQTLKDEFAAEKKEVVSRPVEVSLGTRGGAPDFSELDQFIEKNMTNMSVSLYMNYYFLRKSLTERTEI